MECGNHDNPLDSLAPYKVLTRNVASTMIHWTLPLVFKRLAVNIKFSYKVGTK